METLGPLKGIYRDHIGVYIGVILWLYWGYIRVILGLYRVYIGVIGFGVGGLNGLGFGA